MYTFSQSIDYKKTSLDGCGSGCLALLTFLLVLLLFLLLWLRFLASRLALFYGTLLLLFIGEKLIKKWGDFPSPLKLTPAQPGEVKGDKALGLTHLGRNLCNFLVSGREMGQNGAPDTTVLTDCEGLSCGCVHLASGILLHTVL